LSLLINGAEIKSEAEIMGSLIVGVRPRYGPAATPVVYERTFVGQVIDPLNTELHLTLRDVFLPFDKDNMTNHPHKQRVSMSQRWFSLIRWCAGDHRPDEFQLQLKQCFRFFGFSTQKRGSDFEPKHHWLLPTAPY